MEELLNKVTDQSKTFGKEASACHCRNRPIRFHHYQWGPVVISTMYPFVDDEECSTSFRTVFLPNIETGVMT